MKRIASFLFIGLFLFAGVGEAKEEPMEIPPYEGTSEFNMMKSLTGTWKGTEMMGDHEKEVMVEYGVTSNGSAIVEKLFPQDKDEMISVYHDKDGKLSMTHYCALGNQPILDLSGATENELNFSFSGDNHLDPAKEAHMHSLKITIVNENEIIHNWTYYENGAAGGTNTITLKKVVA